MGGVARGQAVVTAAENCGRRSSRGRERAAGAENEWLRKEGRGVGGTGTVTVECLRPTCPTLLSGEDHLPNERKKCRTK